jgi:hypothetical protein
MRSLILRPSLVFSRNYCYPKDDERTKISASQSMSTYTRRLGI